MRRTLQRRPLPLFLFLLLIVAAAPAAARRQQTQQQPAAVTKETVKSGGRNRTFHLCVPASAGPADRPAPLLLLLHPSGADGSYLVKHWRELAEREGILLAGPEAANRQTWSAPVDGPDFLRDVVEAVRSRHAVAVRRVYLFGYSAGSGFALNMSLIQSEYFAAAAAFASVSHKPQYAEIAARMVPFLLMYSSDDPVFRVEEARASRDALKRRGFPLEWKEYSDRGHDYERHAADLNRLAWDFLRRQELPADPQYVEYQFKR